MELISIKSTFPSEMYILRSAFLGQVKLKLLDSSSKSPENLAIRWTCGFCKLPPCLETTRNPWKTRHPPEGNSTNTSLWLLWLQVFIHFWVDKSKETGVRTHCFCFHCTSKCVCGFLGLLNLGNRRILFHSILSSRLPAELGLEANKYPLFTFTQFLPEAKVPGTCKTRAEGSLRKQRKRSDQATPMSYWW